MGLVKALDLGKRAALLDYDDSECKGVYSAGSTYMQDGALEISGGKSNPSSAGLAAQSSAPMHLVSRLE